MNRIPTPLRRAALAVLVLVGSLAAALGGGWLWLGTDGGRQALAGLLATAASGPGFRVAIGGLEGELPGHLRLRDVTVADHKGRWLAIRATDIHLDAAALLKGRVEIAEVAIDRLDMSRPPLPDPRPAGPSASPPTRTVGAKAGPGLALAVRRLTIAELALGAGMLGGESALLRAEGSAEIGADDRAARADLRFGRRDGQPGIGHLHLAYTPADDRLDVDVAASEPEGGVMARALGLPGLPALAVNAIGVAPLADWHGRVTAAADGRGVLDLAAAVRRVSGGLAIALTGGARPEGMLPAPLAALAGPEPSLALTLLADDEGGLALKSGSRLGLAAGAIAIEGGVDADSRVLALRARTEPAAEALAAVLPPLRDCRWKHAALEADLQIVPGSAPAFGLKAEVDYLTGSAPMITRLAGPHLQAAVHGVAIGGELRFDTISAALASGKLTGSGRLSLAGQGFAATGHLAADHLNRLLGAFGVPVDGIADLDLALSGGGDDARLEVSGTAASLTLGDDTADPPLSALTADGLKLRGVLAMDADGALHARDWHVEGRHLSATGTATLAGGRLAATASLAVPRLADSGVPGLAGAATLDVTVAGPLERPEGRARLILADLGLGGRKLGRSELELAAARLPEAVQATLSLKALAGVQDIEPVAATATLAATLDGKRLSLSGLTLTQSGNRVAGSVQAALEGATIAGLSGHLEGQLPALESLTPLLGQPLRGRGRFELDLGRENGRLVARISGEAAQLRAGGSADAPAFALGDLDLSGSAAAADVAGFAAGRMSGSLALKAHRLRAGGQSFATMDARLAGSWEQASFQATAPGLDLAGSLALAGDGLKVTLDRLASQLGGVAVRLGQPATVDLTPGRVAVTGLRLEGGDFRLAADGRLAADRLEGRLEMEKLPLDLLHLLDPTLPAGGRIGGEIRLAGSGAAPQADLSLRFAGVGQAEADAAGFSVGGFDGTVTGRWAGGRLSFDGGAATSHGAADLHFSGELPLVLRLRPPGLELSPSGSLKGALTGGIDLAALNDLLAASGDRVAGKLAVNVAVSGTVAAPDLGGAVTIEGGRYENQVLGTVVDHIAARLTGNGRAFTVESFHGTTANNGTLAVTGTVRPAADSMFDLHLTAVAARLVQLDDAILDADADLALTGGLAGARLAGSLGIRQADIRLPDQLPAEVVDLHVEESGRGGRHRAETAAGAASPALTPPRRLALALTVNAPGQVMIRGRGLDTEFACALTIGGTAAAPEPRGTMTLVRGKLSVLGKEFQFKRGIIGFPGGAGASPELDLLAEAKASSLTAEAAVTGTVAAPKLVLTSTPTAPQDEVLSRLLFDKPVSQLSALEAVQLADSATQLMGLGGSSGLVDRIRRTLGIDRLGVTSTGTGNSLNPAGKAPGTGSKASGKSSGLGGALEAGRYVSRDVYLGVQQGLTSDSSRAKVEVGISDAVKAEVGVGIRADPEVGLKMQWDY